MGEELMAIGAHWRNFKPTHPLPRRMDFVASRNHNAVRPLTNMAAEGK